MCWRHKFNWITVFALITIMLVSGCATTHKPNWEKTAYGSWQFSHAELEKLPIISLRNILSSVSETENEKVQILVRAQDLEGVAEVKRIAGQEDVIVADPHGQEVKIKIAQITRIQSIRRIKVKPYKETTSDVAEASAEFLIYAPLIPIAIASRPFLGAMGIDQQKISDDEGKAMMAYGGMSKKDLITYVGEPAEEYYCESKQGGFEIWVYEKAQVLRGGRALFIDLDDDAVYNTSVNTTFFKDSDQFNCSLLRR